MSHYGPTVGEREAVGGRTTRISDGRTAQLVDGRTAHAVAASAALLSNELDVHRVAARIAEIAGSLFAARAASVYLAHPEGAWLERLAFTPADAAALPPRIRFADPYLTALAARTGTTQRIAADGDDRAAELPGAESVARALDIGARIAVPIFARGALLAVLTCGVAPGRELGDDDAASLELIAQLASLGLANSLALRAETRRREQLAQLRAACFALAEAPDRATALRALGERAQAVTRAAMAFVAFSDGPGAPFHTWIVAGHDAPRRATRPERCEGVLAEVVIGGHSRALASIDGAPELSALVRSAGPHRFAGVPLGRVGDEWGALFTIDPGGPDDALEEDLHALELLARHGAGVLERLAARERTETELRERRRVEAELRASQEQLAEAQRLAQLGSWEWDLGRDEVSWSDEVYRIFGVDRASFRPSLPRVTELVHPHDRARLGEAHVAALAGAAGDVTRLEYRIVRADGERTLRAQCAVVDDETGRPVRMIGTLFDVTEVRAAERAARRSERQLRELVDRAPDILFVHREGRFLLANRRLCQALGVPAAEGVVGREVVEFIHPADREQLARSDRSPFGATRSPVIARLARADGAPLPVEAVATEVDFEGRPAVLVMARDLSERARAAEEREELVRQLAAERRRLEIVLDNAPVAVMLAGVDGRLQKTNREAERILGEPVPPGTPLSAFVGRVLGLGGSVLTMEELPMQRALSGDPVASDEYALVQSSGPAIPVRGSAVPLRDDDGSVVGVVAVFDEITRIKEAERMREEWTSVVAHDLRQPVSVILAYATMLSRQAATSASREKSDHIASSARRLERMIGDLIDVSSIDSRRLSLRPEPTSLGELARAAVERAGAAVARPIELQVEPGLPPVSVDAARMEQVLANLLSNAQKYGAPGSPVVVDVRREPDGLAIHVSNEGNPIPPAEIPLLFRHFHRSRTARTGRTPGLGLGLYIARGIVEAHGGRVSVTSDEARTTFAVQIPVAGAQLG